MNCLVLLTHFYLHPICSKYFSLCQNVILVLLCGNVFNLLLILYLQSNKLLLCIGCFCLSIYSKSICHIAKGKACFLFYARDAKYCMTMFCLYDYVLQLHFHKQLIIHLKTWSYSAFDIKISLLGLLTFHIFCLEFVYQFLSKRNISQALENLVIS